ncbi:MAG: peptidylprolyl isomerase [Chitinophagaceae bacterium]|jgi:peptidyl-prolyl cis-trans isomerase D|nr:peptidylprolyl isomerase [Chitinophagaceae bacterium]
MSVIQRIRDKGAWIVFAIIALALIAFILQDGVGRGGSMFSNTTVLGKVNGQKIERASFEEDLAMQERMYGAQGVQREQLMGSLWNQEVEKRVLHQEYDKLGLTVTGKELSDILFGMNSPLRQEFTDPNTGEFKVNDAKQAFAQIKKSKNAEQLAMINKIYIDPAVEQTLRNKYLTLLQQSSYIPKWMIEKQQADNNAIANISYVYVPYSSVSDSSVKVSDDDINAYVKKHSVEFQKEEETRSMAYVTFSAAPSASDSAAVLNQVQALRSEFAAATDNAAFLNRVGSDVAFYDSYFSKSRMQVPNKDSIVKTPVGGLYGPYVDGTNFTIAKMVGIKNWPDSARVRHILVATFNPQTNQVIRPDSTGKKLIDSIETAIKGGANFDALVKKYSDDPGSKEKAGVLEFFPQGQMVAAFNEFCFDKPAGSKGVVKTEYGYHYIEILGQKNFNPAYKIAYLSKPIVASPETESAANTAASQFAANSQNRKDFDANAVKAGRQVTIASDVKQNDFSVNGIGSSRQLVRWLYEHKPGTVSEPTAIGDQYIVALVTGINKAGTMTAAEARPMVEGIVRNEKKAKQLLEKFKGNTLEALSTATGAPVLRADSLSFAAPFVPGLGSEPRMVGAAFNKSLTGKVSDPIAGTSGVFAVKVESVGAKAGLLDGESVKQGLLQGSRVAVFRGVDALRRAANIKDYRFKFY